MNSADCPFCKPLQQERILAESNMFVAFLDAFPVSTGHTLIIPRQHVASLFDLSETEFLGLWTQLAAVRSILVERFHPAGFNIGLNDGNAAGQTIEHAHIHIIPRYEGDVPDPRGGVRWIMPGKAKYW